jgi:hypothetical protein
VEGSLIGSRILTSARLLGIACHHQILFQLENHVSNDFTYDIETYKNVFTFAAEHCDYPIKWCFEISDFKDDSRELIEWLYWVKSINGRLVGFNNVGFDYPVVHLLLQMGKATARILYDKAMAIIHDQGDDGDGNKWAHQVKPSDRILPQIDLFKIHHFDNKARATSLKVLEFNMRSENISDLPFPVGTVLTQEQIVKLREYNAHDVSETKKFYHLSKEMIRFREELTVKHSRDFMNHSDVKIGKEIFQMELEKAGVQCYEFGPSGRQPRQTKRDSIALIDCIPDNVKLTHPEFVRVRDWMAGQVITETKGVFKDLVARAGGLEFVFGTGGIHASVENRTFDADAEHMILDVDVTSLYPSIAIEYEYYPEHLGKTFVTTYSDLRTQRVGYKKGTAENAMLKLALNGVYGASNDRYSIFFDPLFTMRVTIAGQLLIAMLAEQLIEAQVEIIQANTDGITLYVKRCDEWYIRAICDQWVQHTKLNLEYVEYKRMVIRDVNNYIAVGTDGKVKRKGAYCHNTADTNEMDWNQNHSALVIPKVAEAVLVNDAPIRETLENWPDKMDFMLRVKVPRSSKLMLHYEGIDYPLENTQRYYVSKGGGQLAKIMPPLARAKDPTAWRRIGVESGWSVCPCNDIKQATLPIEYEYYIREIEKLTLGVM